MVLDLKRITSIIKSLWRLLRYLRSISRFLGDPRGSKTLIEVQEDIEMTKILLDQIIFKMNSLRRDQQYLSNDAKIVSNEVHMRKLWLLKVLIK
jgi:hypothetical protein